MIDTSKYFVREATLNDVDFIATTIIEAEKSGTGKCGLARFYELSEEELKEILIEILEEEIDGCELSLSSFFVVDYEGNAVAASGRWIEGRNEDNLASSILKANLLHYYIPKENWLKSLEKVEIVKDLQIERTPNTFQSEYSYVLDEHRGNFLIQMIDDYYYELWIKNHPDVKIFEYHIFDNNKTMKKVVKFSGDKIVKTYVSHNASVLEYYPCNIIHLVQHYF